MTTKLFIIPSTISPRKGKFTYAQTRSVFTTEERLRHTIFTVNSIQNAYPDGKIVLVDSSDDYNDFKFIFNCFRNVQFVSLKELDSAANELVNTHQHKSFCECLIMNTYYKHFKKQIQEYDFVIKTCGRYFYINFDNFFTEENKNKIFFKKPLNFEWDEKWNYSYVDIREYQNNNRLHQYCTVLFAFGSMHLEKFIDINEVALHLLNQPQMMHYDIETLSYFLTRPYEENIIEVDWKVSGWDGTTGQFMCY